jgi:hypothetical protein
MSEEKRLHELHNRGQEDGAEGKPRHSPTLLDSIFGVTDETKAYNKGYDKGKEDRKDKKSGK